MLPRSILLCAFLPIMIGPARPATVAARATNLPIFLYTAAKTYEPLAWMNGADRFRSGATIFVRDGSSQHPLIPGFASTADPSASFDAQRVLFAGKEHARDPWQVWESLVTGEKPRRITSGSEDCIRPFYLPDDRVVYARKIAGRFVIEVADLAGGKPLALTYNPANSLPTDVLRDGRILFETGFPLGAGTTPEIYTVYSDGSGIESYRCDHGATRHSGRQNSSGDIVFASASGLARFTSALAKEVRVPAPAGEYAGNIAETPSGEWLVSWRSDAKSRFQLVTWKPAASGLRPLVENAEANLIQPTPLTPRVVPNRHPSGLHDWPNANLLCLNAYTSKFQFAPGTIHAVRVYTRDSDGTARLLGTAPVEPDGSFFVQVPTEQPLQIELLDAAGKTLKRQSGFFWMRRGEQRGCVGCHAGPETAPENAVPMILLKSTTPADMTGATTRAAGGD